MRQLLILLGLTGLLAGCAAESASGLRPDQAMRFWSGQPVTPPSTYYAPVDVYIHKGSGWRW